MPRAGQLKLVPPPDCRSCGACCGPPADYATFVDLDREDVERLSAHYRRANVVEQPGFEGEHWALATKRGVNGVTCVALCGRVGTKVWCRIYQDRPELCRKFEPGGRVCQEVRKEVLGA